MWLVQVLQFAEREETSNHGSLSYQLKSLRTLQARQYSLGYESSICFRSGCLNMFYEVSNSTHVKLLSPIPKFNSWRLFFYLFTHLTLVYPSRRHLSSSSMEMPNHSSTIDNHFRQFRHVSFFFHVITGR